MTDMTAFERRVADAMVRRAGPVRPVDDLAVFESVIAANRQQGWGFTMLSALKFVAAAAIVALFGGFLLAGILTTQQGDDMTPGAADRVTLTDDDRGVAVGHGHRGGGTGYLQGHQRWCAGPRVCGPGSLRVDVTPDGSVWLSDIGDGQDLFHLGEERVFEGRMGSSYRSTRSLLMARSGLSVSSLLMAPGCLSMVAASCRSMASDGRCGRPRPTASWRSPSGPTARSGLWRRTRTSTATARLTRATTPSSFGSKTTAPSRPSRTGPMSTMVTRGRAVWWRPNWRCHPTATSGSSAGVARPRMGRSSPGRCCASMARAGKPSRVPRDGPPPILELARQRPGRHALDGRQPRAWRRQPGRTRSTR